MNRDIIHRDGELITANGDFIIGESDMEEVANILQAVQGEYKEFPYTGMNMFRYINGIERKSGMKTRLQMQLEMDDKNYNEIRQQIQIRAIKN